MSDYRTLIEDSLAGKRRAQSELYSRFAPALYGICLRYATGTIEAQDLLQETFIKIFNSLGTFTGSGSFEGWTKRITINLCINHLRQKIKYTSMSDEVLGQLADEESESTETSLRIPDNGTLLEMIQELPEGYRMVFNMYVFENMPHQEIARMAGISENTSKTQLMRARRWLQKRIQQRYT